MFVNFCCPTPRGVGGLKLPVKDYQQEQNPGPTPRGVGGLKCAAHVAESNQVSPTPRGVGGLKSKIA